MQKCCIKGCHSHNSNGSKNLGFFQFPIHDGFLLKKWLKQIDLPNWKPGAYNRICSMHFREEDIDNHPNRKQPYLKPTSVPTVFPQHPVEIINHNISPPLKSNNSHIQLPTNVLKVISDTPLLQSSPVILIRTPYPGDFPLQFPAQLIAQNLNQTAANNSVHVQRECIKQIGAQQLQLPLQNSVPYLKHTKVQNSHTDRIQNPVQIVRNDAQIAAQCQKPILLQTPLRYSKQIALQSSGDIREPCMKQVAMIVASKDSGCNGEKLIPEPAPLPRLRKILPKPQLFNPETLPSGRFLRKGDSSLSNSIPKPDILIIPRVENVNSNGCGNAASPRYPGNKRPILRISINREYDPKKTRCPSDHAETEDLKSDAKIQDASVENANSLTKEMTIENESTNKAVTFKLDPRTGEIVVTTRRLDDSINDEANFESKKTERKVDDISPSTRKFRQLYLKGQQECIALQRKLRVLRHRHKQEQEEIQKLEEHLIELDEKVEGEDPPELRSAKRKGTENIVETEGCKMLLRGVKKIKHNFHTERDSPVRGDLSTTANHQSVKQGNQRSAIRNNGVSRFPKVEFHSPGILDVSEEEIVSEISENCEILLSKVEKANFNGDSEDTDYKEEFLEAEFLME